MSNLSSSHLLFSILLPYLSLITSSIATLLNQLRIPTTGFNLPLHFLKLTPRYASILNFISPFFFLTYELHDFPSYCFTFGNRKFARNGVAMTSSTNGCSPCSTPSFTTRLLVAQKCRSLRLLSSCLEDLVCSRLRSLFFLYYSFSRLS